jgi:hypothetical protein
MTQKSVNSGYWQTAPLSRHQIVWIETSIDDRIPDDHPVRLPCDCRATAVRRDLRSGKCNRWGASQEHRGIITWLHNLSSDNVPVDTPRNN